MRSENARRLLRDEVERLRSEPYEVLLRYLGTEGATAREGKDEEGQPYQIEVESLWDDEATGDLRVVVSLSTTGVRSFVPFTDSFIIRRDGTFVE